MESDLQINNTDTSNFVGNDIYEEDIVQYQTKSQIVSINQPATYQIKVQNKTMKG